ncbi:MAG: hypothetical protein ABIA77_00290, partial [Candidatus Omnitrophota bacterium]
TSQRRNIMEIKTSPHHRQCKYPLCTQILSVYNHEAYCHVHLGSAFWKDKVDGEPVYTNPGRVPVLAGGRKESRLKG